MYERKLDIGVDFGGVSIGDATCRLGVKVTRGQLPLSVADECLCGRRLTGSVVAAGKDDAPGQLHLVDISDRVDGTFDVARFGVAPDSITFGLTFSRESVDVETLSHFAKRSGRLVVESVEVIPADDEDDDDGGDSFAMAGQRILPIRSKPTLTDEGAKMPIGALSQFGMTKKKCESIAAQVGPTIGHLEEAMRNNEWWHRDLKGFGEEWVTRLQDAHLSFRRQHPMPTEEDIERAAEVAAYKAGCEAELQADEISSNPYEPGSRLHAAWEHGYLETMESDPEVEPATIFGDESEDG